MKRKCFLNIFSHFCKQTWLEAEKQVFCAASQGVKRLPRSLKAVTVSFCLPRFLFFYIDRKISHTKLRCLKTATSFPWKNRTFDSISKSYRFAWRTYVTACVWHV